MRWVAALSLTSCLFYSSSALSCSFTNLAISWSPGCAGCEILVFSIGFGPEIVGFNDRHGTRWKIAAIPLGGYVKFFGDENAGSVPDGASPRSDGRARASAELLLSAGAEARGHSRGRSDGEFCSGHRDLCSMIFMLYGKQTMSARVDAVQPDSPAAAAGFQPGDLVVAIDGRTIDNFEDMQRIVSESAGDTLQIKVDRKGAPVLLSATPALKEIKDNFGNVHRIGILGISRSMAAEDLKIQPVSPPQAVLMGAQETWFVIDRTMTLYRRRRGRARSCRPARRADPDCPDFGTGGLNRLCRAHPSCCRTFGLDRAPQSVSDSACSMAVTFCSTRSKPMRGRPLSERAQEFGFRIGLAIVVMLMIFATFNDIVHLTDVLSCGVG